MLHVHCATSQSLDILWRRIQSVNVLIVPGIVSKEGKSPSLEPKAAKLTLQCIIAVSHFRRLLQTFCKKGRGDCKE
jgi:hypothetical protein